MPFLVAICCHLRAMLNCCRACCQIAAQSSCINTELCLILNLLCTSRVLQSVLRPHNSNASLPICSPLRVLMQSVLRPDAKPFISAALRRLFSGALQPGAPGLAFLAAPGDLAWDVPMSKVRALMYPAMSSCIMRYACSVYVDCESTQHWGGLPGCSWGRGLGRTREQGV
jgi:hypothetical protein